MSSETEILVFDDNRCVHSSEAPGALSALKARFDDGSAGGLLVFEADTGRQIDFDLRGSLSEVLARAIQPNARVGPGRPRLGVVGREVSLLPRHWEWLETRPGGASAAIRRLVDEARKSEPTLERTRHAQEAAGRLMTALAGNQRGYEEALRALYASDRRRFEQEIAGWPADVQIHVLRLAEGAWNVVKPRDN